jgi:Predicted glycosyltransferases
MTNSPLVSVIVPLYNAQKYIQQLLQTLQNQTYENIEVLFVDDCSKDETFANMKNILQELSDERFEIIRNEVNYGISKTKNNAIKMISGLYVMLLDQDDLLAIDAIELLMQKAINDSCDYVVGNYVREYDYERKFYDKIFEFQPKMQESNGKLLSEIPSLLVTIHQALWAKIYKIDILKDFVFDESLHGVEDLGSTSILLAKSHKIGVVSKVIYYYQYSKGSTINEANSSYVVTDTFNAYNNVYNYYEAEDLVEKYISELEYLYVYHCVLSVLVRTYQRTENYQKSVKYVYEELERRFPKYKENIYYKKHLKISKWFIVLNKNILVQKVVSKILCQR